MLLMPTSWSEPFAVDLDQCGEESMGSILRAQSALFSVAVLGLPGLSVPMGLRHARPAGVQLVADRFQEDLGLAAAEVIEAEVRAAGAVIH